MRRRSLPDVMRVALPASVRPAVIAVALLAVVAGCGSDNGFSRGDECMDARDEGQNCCASAGDGGRAKDYRIIDGTDCGDDAMVFVP